MAKENILVVDDDKDIARLGRSYLEQAGFSVQVAHDGESALYILRRDRPDLLVLDLMLPDRDGWDITRTVRADERLTALPIIMLTARIEELGFNSQVQQAVGRIPEKVNGNRKRSGGQPPWTPSSS